MIVDKIITVTLTLAMFAGLGVWIYVADHPKEKHRE